MSSNKTACALSTVWYYGGYSGCRSPVGNVYFFFQAEDGIRDLVRSRGLVKVGSKAAGARNYSSCDSLLLGSECGAHTFPYIDVANPDATVEHEATTSKISEDQLLYCNQRGIPTEDAVSLIVGGYAKEVINKLPMEFAVEATKLLSVSLEGSVG